MSQRREAELAGKLPLTPHQRRRLLDALRHTPDAKVYRRLLAIVQLDRGRPATEIARWLGVTRGSIYLWLKRFLGTRDPWAVADRPGRGRPLRIDPPLQQVLEQTLSVPPGKLGYLATGWTLPLLSEHLGRISGRSVSDSTLRRTLRTMDYAFKRPRYRLEPDPEYEKKSEPLSTS